MSTLLSPCDCVSGLIHRLLLSWTSRKKGECCFLLVLYPHTHWDAGSDVLPPQLWPHTAASSPRTLFPRVTLPSSQIQKVISLREEEGQCRKFSLGQSSSVYFASTFFFLSSETRNLISLFSASSMAGVTEYFSFAPLHLRSWYNY